MGVGNITGDFNITDGVTGPAFVTRWVTPYAAFTRGWTKGTISDQDFNDFLSYAVDDSQVFVPTTGYSLLYQAEVEPLLERLLQASLTSYEIPRMDLIARYFACCIEAYSILYSIAVLNNVAFYTDWKQYYPYSGVVPPALYTLASQFAAEDVNISINYSQYMRRLESEILPPWIVKEIQRVLTPLKSPDMHARMFIPTALDLDNDTYVDVNGRLYGLFSLLDILSEARRVVTAYLPYPMNKVPGLWEVAPAQMDAARLVGWFNSGNQQIDPFGDTGDPEDYQVPLCYDQATDYPDQAVIYTGTGSPTWEEVKFCSVFQKTYDVVDNTFSLLSPHRSDNIAVWDNYSQNTVWDGSTVATTDNKFELTKFIYNRWILNSADTDHGVQEPGLIFSTVKREGIIQMLRMEVHDNFHGDEMKALASAMAGSYLRFRRREVNMMTT
jgi:hypothetical protein